MQYCNIFLGKLVDNLSQYIVCLRRDFIKFYKDFFCSLISRCSDLSSWDMFLELTDAQNITLRLCLSLSPRFIFYIQKGNGCDIEIHVS
jgi:hypothetical protein